MSNTITDLTGTTWQFNDSVTTTGLPTVFNYNGTISKNNYSVTFTKMNVSDSYADWVYWNSSTETTNINYYPTYGWYYRSTSSGSDRIIFDNGPILVITGGTDATNSTLRSWLEANATQQSSTTTYDITTTLTNLAASGDSTIDSDGTAAVTLSANSGYTLPSSITVTNAQYTYDSSTGVIGLSNATDDVTISASGVKIIISSFNELEVIDHTEYITLRVQDVTINVAKQTTPAQWDGTDLTGTTWLFNNIVDATDNRLPSDISFISNNVNYDYFYIDSDGVGGRIYYTINNPYTDTHVYDNGVWLSNSYKTISIIGGTDAINQDLIDWLQANAILISW